MTKITFFPAWPKRIGMPGDKGGFLSGDVTAAGFHRVTGGAAWQVSSTRGRPLGVLAGPQGLSKPGVKESGA